MLTNSLYFISSAALAFLLAVGCQSAAPMSAQAPAMPERAIVVNGGNTGSYTVFLASVEPNNPVILCSAGTAVCPECKAAAIKYFQTGVLDPKCSRTGATRSTITAVDQSIGHQ